ncbi:hypothetical protein HOY80DRAFT_962308 [Tuber brumale]|nr:hypothetical protein HOY80DRAFT_962308 [Tuber brumale]
MKTTLYVLDTICYDLRFFFLLLSSILSSIFTHQFQKYPDMVDFRALLELTSNLTFFFLHYTCILGIVS